ncbi:hypothetical protein DPMN_139317 [Dreissena polymorpha]|uniref:Uncharacterized protein n=1 Tax=Dreissena polymorpha TaxID=45954 RepID=A0A9D4JJC6_DREPO|nr:hypothetical protein DPMN_139317 [Dreissena polymorpha]
MCTGRQFNDIHWLSLNEQGYSPKRVLKNVFFPILARCAACKASTDATSRRPEPQNGFPQLVERTGYRRPSTFPLSSLGHTFEILVCVSAQGPPRPSSTLPPPLSPSLFRRCSETTIYLRTITIPLSVPSKFWESAKSAGKKPCGSRDDCNRLINRD